MSIYTYIGASHIPEDGVVLSAVGKDSNQIEQDLQWPFVGEYGMTSDLLFEDMEFVVEKTTDNNMDIELVCQMISRWLDGSLENSCDEDEEALINAALMMREEVRKHKGEVVVAVLWTLETDFNIFISCMASE